MRLDNYLDSDFKRISYTRDREGERMAKYYRSAENVNLELYSQITNCRNLRFIQSIFAKTERVLKNRSYWGNMDSRSKRVVLGLIVHMDLGESIRFRSESGQYYKNDDKARFEFYTDITYRHTEPDYIHSNVYFEYKNILMSMRSTYQYDLRQFCEKRKLWGLPVPDGLNALGSIEELPGGIRVELCGY